MWGDTAGMRSSNFVDFYAQMRQFLANTQFGKSCVCRIKLISFLAHPQVLGTRKLMHVSFDEFEKVLTACFDVFCTWDDEFDRLQGLLRDLVKKKREEHLKMVWRVNPAHKRLQARLDQMRKYGISRF